MGQNEEGIKKDSEIQYLKEHLQSFTYELRESQHQMRVKNDELAKLKEQITDLAPYKDKYESLLLIQRNANAKYANKGNEGAFAKPPCEKQKPISGEKMNGGTKYGAYQKANINSEQIAKPMAKGIMNKSSHQHK